ncbi:hypothetical protein FA95DRAFT_1492341, partial [Auriscalpium vulgare]
GPSWTCETFLVEGDRIAKDGRRATEEIELWKRNPVECIQELLGNPAFREHMHYAPAKIYEDMQKERRVFEEMWSADWWHSTQDQLPLGATIAPIILSSDKTQLSQFSGDKSAWPVYLTVGNISSSKRRESSARATVLIGYIPVSKLECFSDATRSLEGYRVFHTCMRSLLRPIIAAGLNGVMMTCADGLIRKIFPILAAYVADYPEQCLVACCKENRCPCCTVAPEDRGEPIHSSLRNHRSTLATLAQESRGENPPEFKAEGLRAVKPFWADLPHCNIFECFTPDILHQLHKGVFKDHLVSWTVSLAKGGEDEIDERFKAMPQHPSLRHFKKGISVVSQWTGTEYKNMEKVFLGVISGGVVNVRVIRAVRGILDFIYYAHFESHTEETLASMDRAWEDFHEFKDVFVDEGIRSHFNIPKIHIMTHYTPSIRSRGTAAGFNTEASERLHIDYAKDAYRASNKRDYTAQMTRWLSRRDTVHRFRLYQEWLTIGRGEEQVEGDNNVAVGDDMDEASTAGVKVADGVLVSHEDFHIRRIIPKSPSFPRLTAEQITVDFGAVDFLNCLTTFMAANPTSFSPRVVPLPTDRFDVFKRLTLHLPAPRQVSLRRLLVQDVVRAVPAQAAHGRQKETAAIHDIALAVEHPTGTPVDSVEGLTVCQVRVIFQLPHYYHHGKWDGTLAYVEWFTKMNSPVPNLRLYQVSRSTRRGGRRASIIPVNHIQQSCHLFPKYPRSLDGTSLTSDKVYEQASQFYVNPFLRHLDFVHFQPALSPVPKP